MTLGQAICQLLHMEGPLRFSELSRKLPTVLGRGEDVARLLSTRTLQAILEVVEMDGEKTVPDFRAEILERLQERPVNPSSLSNALQQLIEDGDIVKAGSGRRAPYALARQPRPRDPEEPDWEPWSDSHAAAEQQEAFQRICGAPG